MPAEQMLTHVQSKVFPFIKDLNGEASNFTHHMKPHAHVVGVLIGPLHEKAHRGAVVQRARHAHW